MYRPTNPDATTSAVSTVSAPARPLNVHDELMKSINDENLVRQAVEAALPQFKIIDRYKDADGNLCSRAVLARADVDLAAYAALHPAPTHGG